MTATLGHSLLKVTAAVAVVLASFWLTLKLLDYLATPEDPNADLIEITLTA
jgi:hypothetical protein